MAEERRWNFAPERCLGCQVFGDRLVDAYANPVTVLDHARDAGELHDGKAHFESVSVESSRERLRDDGADTRGFQCLGRDRAARRAPEVPSRADDVARLDLFGEFRIQRLEHVLADRVKARDQRVGGRDGIRGNVVPEFPTPAFKDQCLGHREDAMIPWRPLRAPEAFRFAPSYRRPRPFHRLLEC